MKTLNGMIIVIPTFGRAARQITLKELPKALRKITHLCCVKSEFEDLRAATGHDEFVFQPAAVKTIHQKRQFIMDWALNAGVKKVMMLDDDMFWQARGPKGLIKEYADETKVVHAMTEMSQLLDEFAHAGFSSRLGNNRVASEYARTTRMMHSLGYNVKAFHEAGARFDRVHGKEDFDVTLQLLKRGYDNVVVYHTCISPGKYDAPGGCSTERTLETANENAKKLQALHPEHVSLVQKEFKNSPRMEVMMKWKKAFGAGVEAFGERRISRKRGEACAYDIIGKGEKA